MMAACGDDGTERTTAISASDGGVAALAGSTSSSPNTATLTWDAVTHPDLRSYRIYYGPEPGEYLQIRGQGIDTGNATTHTVEDLTSGRRYYFVVTAVDMLNNESDFSNEVFKNIP